MRDGLRTFPAFQIFLAIHKPCLCRKTSILPYLTFTNIHSLIKSENLTFVILKYCFNHSQLVPLFEAEKQDEFEDVYEEDRAITTSSSSGRLASLWGGENPGEDFVVINEAESSRTNSTGQLDDTR